MLYGKTPSLVLSLMADYSSGEITLHEDELDQYAWVTIEEAENYSLISGIWEELVMAENKRKGEKSEWRRLK